MTTNLHPLRREAEPTVSMFTPSIIVTLRFIAHRVLLIHATYHRPTVYNGCAIFINHLCSICCSHKEVKVSMCLRLEVCVCVLKNNPLCYGFGQWPVIFHYATAS